MVLDYLYLREYCVGTVLVQYERTNRQKNSYLIEPYLEGYDESLQEAAQTADKLTGSDKEIQWQLTLLEQKLKMCTYYVKTWGDREAARFDRFTREP